ncbi:MAG: hypothetical protein WC641_04035 [Patescibacteria group bacterium]
MRKISFAAINGYGIPRDILTDMSYHAYLVQVFNYVWRNYGDARLTLIPTGGKTDLFPPYKRTEAGEMARWFKPRIKKLKLKWDIETCGALTALENMLTVKRLVGNASGVYFCELSRRAKMQRLAREVFGNKVRVIGLEFDGSAPGYDLKTRRAMERLDVRYGLLALKDSAWRKKMEQAARLKIKTLRKTDPQVRATEIDRIALAVQKEFLNRSCHPPA